MIILEEVMMDLQRQVARSIEAQEEACRTMQEAAELITQLRAENAELRRQVGKLKLLADLREDGIAMLKPQAG